MLGGCEALALAGREAAAGACYSASATSTALWLAAAFLFAVLALVAYGMWRRDQEGGRP